MAYIVFRDNYILPKDITEYILTFLGPSNEEMNFIRELYYTPCWDWVKFQFGMYNFLKGKHLYTIYSDHRKLTSFHEYLLPRSAMKKRYLGWVYNMSYT